LKKEAIFEKTDKIVNETKEKVNQKISEMKSSQQGFIISSQQKPNKSEESS
jgi:CHASE3 domain sensor protein